MAVIVAATAYAVLAHLSNSGRLPAGAGIALAVGPILAAGALCAVRSRWRHLLWLACALGAWCTYLGRDFLAGHFSWLYLLQQVAAYAALGFAFGRSLIAQRVPLCTYWATLVHGSLPPAAVRYTRAVTAAWTALFAAIAVALVAVFVLAPLATWSAFANFGVFPLLVAMFIGEYLVRLRALPDMPPASILAGPRAYLDATRDPAAAPRA